MIKLGIIGTGYIAHLNYEGIRDYDEVSVTAVCNRTREKAEAFTGKYQLDGCPVYTDYRDMVREADINAVLINTPHDLHEETFIHCADHKLNILVEKPLTLTSKSAAKMMESARWSGIRAAVCHTQRYNSAFIAAREYIDSHDLGKLIAVNDVLSIHYFWDGRPGWALDPIRSGDGITMNYGVHQFDRITHMAGKRILKLFGHVDHDKQGFVISSGYHAMGVMEDGVSFSALCAGYSAPYVNRMDMIFEKGTLHIALQSDGCDRFGVYFGDNETGAFAPVPVSDEENHHMYHRQFGDMVDLLCGRKSGAVSLPYAASMVTLVEAMHRSHETGEAVLLE